jgi:hypothetical protein
VDPEFPSLYSFVYCPILEMETQMPLCHLLELYESKESDLLRCLLFHIFSILQYNIHQKCEILKISLKNENVKYLPVFQYVTSLCVDIAFSYLFQTN